MKRIRGLNARRASAAALLTMLGACSGEGSGPAAAGSNVGDPSRTGGTGGDAGDGLSTGSPSSGAPSTAGTGAGVEASDCFTQKAATLGPWLTECRACHTSQGTASEASWLLSDNPSEDADRLSAAWQTLGADLLAVPSGQSENPHAGGVVLRPDSDAYTAFAKALDALEDPGGCETDSPAGDGGAAANGSAVPATLPLLGSDHGGHVWVDFCEGKPDATPLPVDPRTQVLPGVSDDRAVVFNAHWVECEENAPTTCGEYREGYARGKRMMEDEGMSFFGGDYTDALLVISAADYNNLWIEWGYLERPEEFDALVAERWGVPLAEKRNPYPLPSEDPNTTHGGSGQLPAALTQLRDDEGNYLGRMGFNCHWCHSGKVGDADEGPGLGTLYGSGNSLLDVSAGFGNFVGGATSLIPIGANKVRGSGDILLYPAIAALDVDRALHYNESLVNAPSQGSVDYPVWWNLGHRTRRFHDGSFAMDDARPVMGFFMPLFRTTSVLNVAAGREWIEERDEDLQLWMEAIESPAYPGAIDTSLAEAGAVLFHRKDLWADGLYNPVPRPAQGNGSCASCHGAYAPRYVNDPTFLADPTLAGIAANVVPLDVIGTDPARANSLTDRLGETLAYSWWGYGELGEEGVCFSKIADGGYLAPPLHGVWASAPYFHNGSVPDVWAVLDPGTRPEIWQRVTTPPPESSPDAFMGFDANLARAYDHDKLGWRYKTFECGDPFAEPELDCGPSEEEVLRATPDDTYDALWFTWNVESQPRDRASLEKRMIYNTHTYSQGNHGHLFSSALTDAERRALIEYLKTL